MKKLVPRPGQCHRGKNNIPSRLRRIQSHVKQERYNTRTGRIRPHGSTDFCGSATPAEAAEEHSNNAPSAAGHVAGAARDAVVVDHDDRGQVRIDIPTTIAPDARMEAVNSHVEVRDGEAHLNFSAATTSGIDPSYLNEFAAGFTAGGGIVTGSEAHVEQSATPSRRARSACVGRNRAWQEFLWFHIEMDSCIVHDIVQKMRNGGNATAIAGFIMARIPGAGTIAGSIASGAGLIASLGANIFEGCGFPGGRPRGATLHLTGVPWCGTQS